MSFVILNIPHSGKEIPDEYRKDILLNDDELKKEIDYITDMDTDKIFYGYEGAYTGIICKTSRFLCDMERFVDDMEEPMAQLGMGVVYTKTPFGRPLREFDAVKRQQIIEKFYWPYHNKLTGLVENALANYNKCLLIDCHSYYEDVPFIEKIDTDICIGADSYHTDQCLVDRLMQMIREEGYIPSVNAPFSGALVPLKYYRLDSRVKSVMFELNKRIYVNDGKTDMIKLTKLQSMFLRMIKVLEDMVAKK